MRPISIGVSEESGYLVEAVRAEELEMDDSEVVLDRLRQSEQRNGEASEGGSCLTRK